MPRLISTNKIKNIDEKTLGKTFIRMRVISVKKNIDEKTLGKTIIITRVISVKKLFGRGNTRQIKSMT